MPALLLFAYAIFRFRRVLAMQKIQIGKQRLKLGFLQGATTNTERGRCFRFVKGDENGEQPQPVLAQVPRFTDLFCHESLHVN